MDNKAKRLLLDYILETIDMANLPEGFEIFIVWKCKVLQNCKYLLCTNLPDQKYYELTYDGDKHRWYLDEYEKKVNRVIPDYGLAN